MRTGSGEGEGRNRQLGVCMAKGHPGGTPKLPPKAKINQGIAKNREKEKVSRPPAVRASIREEKGEVPGMGG